MRRTVSWLALLASVLLLLAGCDAPPPGYKQALIRLHESNFDAAGRALLPLAASGHAPSQFHLAMILLKIPELRAEGVKWLQRAAQSGNLAARYQLALAHRDGANLPQSIPAAVEELRGLAKEGFVPAQFDLARLLERQGGGSLAEARAWYERAAEGGHEGAVQRIAAAYEKGEIGEPADPKQAAAWRDRFRLKSF